MSKKRISIIIGLVVAVVGWYLFRPERLWINQTVNEAFPGEAGVQAADKSGPEIIYARPPGGRPRFPRVIQLLRRALP